MLKACRSILGNKDEFTIVREPINIVLNVICAIVRIGSRFTKGSLNRSPSVVRNFKEVAMPQRHPIHLCPIQQALQIPRTAHASISATIASICARRSVIRATVVARSALRVTMSVTSRVSFGST